MSRSLIASLASLAVIALTSPSSMTAQNKVVNGSFENPGLAFPGTTLQPGSTFITGWTVTAGTIDYGGLGWTSASGSNSIDLNGNNANGSNPVGGIFQDIGGLSIGSSYDLFFAMAGNGGDGSSAAMAFDKSLAVLWGPVGGPLVTVGSFTFVQAGHGGNNMGWMTMSHPGLVATSAAMRLEFLSTTPPAAFPLCCVGPTLDDVVLTQRATTTPEPANVALLATGLIGVSGVARRRRTA